MNKPRPLIAVVDDEEAVGRALQRLLRAVGFDVAMHTSGAAFLDWLGVLSPDCVILDMHMVPLDGMEVLRRLMQRPDRPPVVFITGHDSQGVRESALAAGASAYLTKPVDGQKLIDAIHEAMAGSSSP